jgi:hypothetical protein
MNQASRYDDYGGTQKRVEKLIFILGICGIAVVSLRWGARAGLSFVVGTGLGWINFRWLKQGVRAILPVPVPSADAGGPSPGSIASMGAAKVPKVAFAKFFGRYVLLAASLYVILAYSWLPAAAFFAGFFVVVAAVVAGFSYALIANKP